MQEAGIEPVAPTPPPQEAPKSVKGSTGTTSYKTVKKWRVVDEVKLRNQHPELFMLDQVALRKLITSGVEQIDGVEFYEEKEVAHRIS